MEHYIILYYTILYYTILYYTILYYTILYYTILYYTILYYTILYYTILYYTILYYTILYYTILYYTILYYTILYYTILYYTILYQPLFLKHPICAGLVEAVAQSAPRACGCRDLVKERAPSSQRFAARTDPSGLWTAELHPTQSCIHLYTLYLNPHLSLFYFDFFILQRQRDRDRERERVRENHRKHTRHGASREAGSPPIRSQTHLLARRRP